MKNKILIILTLILIATANVHASKFKFIFTPNVKEAMSPNEQVSPIYIDTVNHWCNYSATRLYNEGVFSGIKIGEKHYFRPEEQITRGDFLLYIDTILKTEDVKATSLPFADVESIPIWQKQTVKNMYNLKIINGNEENGRIYFNHDEGITRMEAALILNNILGTSAEYKPNDYSDSYLIPKYASGAVKNVTDYGIMQGYTDNSFRPYIKINRAMLSDILCRLKDYNKK